MKYTQYNEDQLLVNYVHKQTIRLKIEEKHIERQLAQTRARIKALEEAIEARTEYH